MLITTRKVLSSLNKIFPFYFRLLLLTAVFGLRGNQIFIPGKIQPHAKAGIMPSTHTSEEQEDPTLAGKLAAILPAVFC
jgi:hypothetical protein